MATTGCDITVGVFYSFQFTATGGVDPLVWEEIEGVPGLEFLDPATGVYSGTATSSGTFTIKVRVTDATLATATITCESTVAPAVGVIPELCICLTPREVTRLDASPDLPTVIKCDVVGIC